MTDAAVDIESDQLLEDVEHHFRVQAGPGAGKTHWVVGHIKNALHKSKRLTPASRIACISYTNVAVDEIRERLGPAADRVNVSTIHSFLYRNVVKPYLHLLRDGQGLPLVSYAKVDGHNEHRPSKRKVKAWLNAVDKKGLWHLAIKKWPKWSRCLQKLIWERNSETGCWSLKLLPNTERPEYFPATKLDKYKPFYWNEGTIDHEDVLYFAHRILEEKPLIGAFLSARFRYIFVDEFQDTNPVQTQAVKWLADAGSIVGVIGDAEQAIYGFQGAKRDDFVGFLLPDLRDYQIRGNRRSTARIVDLLNHVRADQLNQQAIREVDGVLVPGVPGEPVRLIVGETAKTVDHARTVLNGSELHVLARNNDQVVRLRTETGVPSDNTWDRFEEVDHVRARFFQHLITGIEAGRVGNFTFALKEVLAGIRLRDGKVYKPLNCAEPLSALQRRGIAVSLLEHMLTAYDDIAKKSLRVAYDTASKAFGSLRPPLSLTRIQLGKGFARFADSVPYKALASAVTLSDETRTVRTMHSAKGAEFANVLVCLEEDRRHRNDKGNRLDHILDPGDSDDKERRVTYVAISRAQDRLFLSVPALTASEEDRLRNLSVQVIRVP